jgi:hypothetical protein
MSESSAFFSVVVFIFCQFVSAHLMIEPLGKLFRPSIFLYKYMAKRQYLVSHSSKVNMVLIKKGFICTHSIFLYISKKNPDNETYSFQTK